MSNQSSGAAAARTLKRCFGWLGVDDRKKLYRLIAAALDERKLRESIELGGYFQVKLATGVHDAEDRIERFAKWKKKLVTREDIPVVPVDAGVGDAGPAQ